MASWIWVLIPIVAIVGAYIIDYQKNKFKWQSKNKQSDKELEEMRKLMQQIKQRVENLEAIAADDPTELQGTTKNPLERIELDDASVKSENELKVNNMAKNKGE